MGIHNDLEPQWSMPLFRLERYTLCSVLKCFPHAEVLTSLTFTSVLHGLVKFLHSTMCATYVCLSV